MAQPRWIPWHVFCAAALAGCLWMAGWQWHVATAPAPAGVEVSVWRNYAYAVNWLIFAVVGVWFWWRLPRDQMRSEAAEAAGVAAVGAPNVEQGAAEESSGEFDASFRSSEAGEVHVPVDGVERTKPVTRQNRFDPFTES